LLDILSIKHILISHWIFFIIVKRCLSLANMLAQKFPLAPLNSGENIHTLFVLLLLAGSERKAREK
jgi:hypothetical protein